MSLGFFLLIKSDDVMSTVTFFLCYLFMFDEN